MQYKQSKTLRLTLRTKLALVSLTLLLIPWVGYRYLQAVESYLRQGREAVLLERAHAAAALLAEHPQIFVPRDEITTPPDEHVFVRPLRAPIQLDGYDDDWEMYRDRVQKYAAEHVLYSRGKYRPDSLSFTLQMGSYRGDVYAMVRVRDDRIVYRDPNSPRMNDSDHVELAIQDRDGALTRYIFATSAPGWIGAQRLTADDGVSAESEPRIKGEWQETQHGYNIELRIPQSLLGARMAISVNDVDNARTRAITTTIGTASSQQPGALSSVGVPAPQIQKLLHGLTPGGARTWVVDVERRVVALEGGLKPRTDDSDTSGDGEAVAPTSGPGSIVHVLYRLLLTQPNEEFQDDLSSVSQLDGPDVISALAGSDATRWRLTPDRRVSILTAAAPVRVDDRVIGAVAVEETGNGILILQNQALETLINLSIVAFGVAVAVLLVFATRLSLRVRRLRDAAETAIGPDGRVQATTISTRAGDELGDLARSFQGMLERLTQYNRYLETMAAKLSHELRTPITVVRSSLENLDSAPSPRERETFLQRAREGIERLNNILTRMSEATRLENTLQTEVRTTFDLEQVVTGCVSGYRIAHPQQTFELLTFKRQAEQKVLVDGAPDLIAQLMDKLVSNARDFHAPGTPIVVRLDADKLHATLSVLNQGPRLPEEMSGRLFDSMVSLRAERGSEPHLGLGLYIVRLIAEFHRGSVTAANRGDVDGAVFSVTLPLVSTS